MRENEIRNSLFKLEELGNASAADYYMDFCLKKEKEYNEMKKNVPLYFEGAKSLITALDSKDICERVYSYNNELYDLCKTSLNGVLNLGLGNAFYFMYSQILKNNLIVTANIEQQTVNLT